MKRSASGIVTAALVLVAALAVAPASNAAEGSLSAAPSPMGQTDATVWSLAYANGAVYAVGDFTHAASAGGAMQPRQFMAAWNTSGALTTFSHTFTTSATSATCTTAPCPVRPSVVAASPDGSRIYVGGGFTAVDGLARSHVAAFNTSDGSLVSTTLSAAGSWPVQAAGKVTAIAVSANNSEVYLAGTFFEPAGHHGGSQGQGVAQAEPQGAGSGRHGRLVDLVGCEFGHGDRHGNAGLGVRDGGRTEWVPRLHRRGLLVCAAAVAGYMDGYAEYLVGGLAGPGDRRGSD